MTRQLPKGFTAELVPSVGSIGNRLVCDWCGWESPTFWAGSNDLEVYRLAQRHHIDHREGIR